MRHDFKQYISYYLVCTFFAICLLAGGCKSRKQAASVKIGKKEAEKALVLTQQQKPNYQRLSITGKAEADVPKEGFNMSFNYRMHLFKDSLIWMRFTKLGIEAVRVVISPDSVFIRDNLNESYRKEGYELAKRITGLNVDFELLEDIFLGNLNIIPSRLELEGELVNPLLFLGTSAGTSFQYTVDAKQYKLIRLETTNEVNNQHTLLTYSDFNRHANALIPESGKVQVLSPENLSVEFKHNRIIVNPENLSANFSIPKSYKRMMD